jgi:hypothetical protein
MMAAATSVTSFVTALGPMKIEVVKCTMAATLDTYVSKLVSPKFCFALLNDTGTANSVTAITDKSIAVTNADISASDVLLIIVGF